MFLHVSDNHGFIRPRKCPWPIGINVSVHPYVSPWVDGTKYWSYSLPNLVPMMARCALAYFSDPIMTFGLQSVALNLKFTWHLQCPGHLGLQSPNLVCTLSLGSVCLLAYGNFGTLWPWTCVLLHLDIIVPSPIQFHWNRTPANTPMLWQHCHSIGANVVSMSVPALWQH